MGNPEPQYIVDGNGKLCSQWEDTVYQVLKEHILQNYHVTQLFYSRRVENQNWKCSATVLIAGQSQWPEEKQCRIHQHTMHNKTVCS